MKLIKDIEGWTLHECKDGFIITTPTQHTQKLDLHYKNMITSKFNETVKRGWIWVDYEYYTVNVYMSEIVCTKQKSQSYSTKIEEIRKTRYQTKELAIEAINKVLPYAKEKFTQCSNALQELHNTLNFESGDTYEGDTYGTYNDHSYISFDIEGFSFSFINE